MVCKQFSSRGFSCIPVKLSLLLPSVVIDVVPVVALPIHKIMCVTTANNFDVYTCTVLACMYSKIYIYESHCGNINWKMFLCPADLAMVHARGDPVPWVFFFGGVPSFCILEHRTSTSGFMHSRTCPERQITLLGKCSESCLHVCITVDWHCPYQWVLIAEFKP